MICEKVDHADLRVSEKFPSENLVLVQQHVNNKVIEYSLTLTVYLSYLTV